MNSEYEFEAAFIPEHHVQNSEEENRPYRQQLLCVPGVYGVR